MKHKNVVELNADGTYSGYFEGDNVWTGKFEECYQICVDLKRDQIQKKLNLRIQEVFHDGTYIVCSGEQGLEGHNGTYEQAQLILNGIVNAYISPLDFMPTNSISK